MNNTIQGLPHSGLQDLKPALTEPSGTREKFFDTFQQAIGEVNRLQAEAQVKVTDLLEGKGDDVHQAMIAVEKADVAFQLMMQVRNKIVAAYQEVSRIAL
jgi:flagellar hook-basal body complex protein FliE